MDLLKAKDKDELLNDLMWLREPLEWSYEPGRLVVVPKEKTDFFRPYQGEGKDNACFLYSKISGDFTAEAHIRARHVDFADAGALMIRVHEELWAKACVERSPIGEVNVVTVVTNRFSDDCNSEILEKPECFVRVSRRGNVFGIQYSLDGIIWRFVRTFGLPVPDEIMVGLVAQAPFTGGGHAEFSAFSLREGGVEDLRSGV